MIGRVKATAQTIELNRILGSRVPQRRGSNKSMLFNTVDTFEINGRKVYSLEVLRPIEGPLWPVTPTSFCYDEDFELDAEACNIYRAYKFKGMEAEVNSNRATELEKELRILENKLELW